MSDFKPLPEGIIRHPLGFYEVENKPSEAELQAYYAEKYYQQEKGNYRTAYPDAELRYMNHKIEQSFHTISRLRGSGTGTVLDIGCGEGFTLAWFKARGWEVSGLDYSTHGCEAMNPECLPYLTHGDIYQNLQQLISENRKFDVLWMTNVLEHVRDPLALLEHCAALVTGTSVLVVRVPNDFSELQQHLTQHKHLKSPFWVAVPDHLCYFNRESLENTMHSTGWRTEQMMADFPIDWYLVNEASNYNLDPTKGGAAHQSRITLENLIAARPPAAINAFYEKLADLGMGRQLTGFFTRS